MIFSDAEARQRIEAIMRGRPTKCVEINWVLYRHLLGMPIGNIDPLAKTTVSRQKLRQVHSQFIARLVANRLES